MANASRIRGFTAHEFAMMFRRCAKASPDLPECVLAFAQAFLLADYSDQVILWPAATQLAIKYELEGFLAAAGSVDGVPEPKQRGKRIPETKATPLPDGLDCPVAPMGEVAL